MAGNSRSKWFVLVLALILAVLVDIAAAATTTTTVKPSTTTTKPSTTTTATKPTTTTTTTTTKPSSTTNSTKTYTWTTVGKNGNCPYSLYSITTSTFATATTSTSGGIYATAFADHFQGAIPSMIGLSNATKKDGNYAMALVNSSQIILFTPNKTSIIMDEMGVTWYDQNCTQGVRLTIPNFFPFLINGTKPKKRATPVELEERSPALAARTSAATAFSVVWQYADKCSKMYGGQLNAAYVEFDCACMPSPRKQYANWSPQRYGGYANITTPTIDPSYVDDKIDAMVKFVSSNPYAEAVELSGAVVTAAQLLLASTGATAAALAFLAALGAPELGTAAIVIATAIELVGLGTTILKYGAPLLKKGLYNTQNYSYSLTGDWGNEWGTVLIDSQLPPFKNVTSKTVTVPIPDFQNDVDNCGSCGHQCLVKEACQAGKCVPKDNCPQRQNGTMDPCIGTCKSPSNTGCESGNVCSYAGNTDGTCICRYTMGGQPACVWDNFDDFCKWGGTPDPNDFCKTDKDCQCGSMCVKSGCCGGGLGVCAYGGYCNVDTSKACDAFLRNNSNGRLRNMSKRNPWNSPTNLFI